MTLKELLHQGNVAEALTLVEELEEMGKSDKLNKVFSYGVILLLHLIKQAAEKRTTKSWDTSIFNSVKQIQRSNQRWAKPAQRPSKQTTYLTQAELLETLQDTYESALRNAALEAFEGRYEAQEIAEMVDRQQIVDQAIELILGD